MIQDDVITAVAEVLKKSPEDIAADSTFDELGVDSLDGIEIVMQLEDKYDIEISDEDARSMKSVRQVVETLEKALGESGKGEDDEGEE